MKWNDQSTPTPQSNLPKEKISPDNRFIQNRSIPEDIDEDPMLTEGYLPEIYFTLKSEDPADW
jgi:hypothetical protein